MIVLEDSFVSARTIVLRVKGHTVGSGLFHARQILKGILTLFENNPRGRKRAPRLSFRQMWPFVGQVVFVGGRLVCDL